MKIILLTISLLFTSCVSFAGTGSYDLLDATSAYVDFGNNSAHDVTQITVAIWAITDNGNKFNTCATRDNNVAGERNFRLGTGGSIDNGYRWICWKADNTTVTAESTTNFSTGTWTFLAGTSDTSNCRLWVSRASDSMTNTATTSMGGANLEQAGRPLRTGLRDGGGGQWYGEVAWLQYYNRALNSAELEEIKWKPCSIKNGLVGCYPLTGLATEEDWSTTNASGSVTAATPSSNGPPVNVKGGGQ